MPEEKEWELCPFIAFLLELSPEKDRGTLADLRKGFSKATEVRAWPYIGRFCRLDNDRDRTIFQSVAAGYATHPVNDATQFANIGSVMQKLAAESVGGDSEKRKSFDTMFRRLLACETAEEVCTRIKRTFLAAKSKDIPIPWNSLFWDLMKWGDSIKVRWAANYWSVPKEIADIEGSDASEDEENAVTSSEEGES